jgi:hypothetical protein
MVQLILAEVVELLEMDLQLQVVMVDQALLLFQFQPQTTQPLQQAHQQLQQAVLTQL